MPKKKSQLIRKKKKIFSNKKSYSNKKKYSKKKNNKIGGGRKSKKSNKKNKGIHLKGGADGGGAVQKVFVFNPGAAIFTPGEGAAAPPAPPAGVAIDIKALEAEISSLQTELGKVEDHLRFLGIKQGNKIKLLPKFEFKVGELYYITPPAQKLLGTYLENNYLAAEYVIARLIENLSKGDFKSRLEEGEPNITPSKLLSWIRQIYATLLLCKDIFTPDVLRQLPPALTDIYTNIIQQNTPGAPEVPGPYTLPEAVFISDSETLTNEVVVEKIVESGLVNFGPRWNTNPITEQDFQSIGKTIQATKTRLGIPQGERTASDEIEPQPQNFRTNLLKILPGASDVQKLPTLINFLLYHYLKMLIFYKESISKEGTSRQQFNLDTYLRAIDNHIFSSGKDLLKFILHKITHTLGPAFPLIIVGGAAFRALLAEGGKQYIQTTDYDAFVLMETTSPYKEIVKWLEALITQNLKRDPAIGPLFMVDPFPVPGSPSFSAHRPPPARIPGYFYILHSDGEPNKPYKISLLIDGLGFKPLIEITFKQLIPAPAGEGGGAAAGEGGGAADEAGS